MAPTHKVSGHLNDVVMLDHVTKEKHIFAATKPMPTKRGGVMTYNEEILLAKLHDPSVTQFCEVI